MCDTKIENPFLAPRCSFLFATVGRGFMQLGDVDLKRKEMTVGQANEERDARGKDHKGKRGGTLARDGHLYIGYILKPLLA